MKKNFLLIIIVLLIPFMVFAYVKGDVDGKNGVDNMDYVLVRNYIRKTSSLTSEELKRADVDGENGIDNMDYVLIRNIVRGLSPIETPTLTPTLKPTIVPKLVTKISLNRTSASMYVSDSEILKTTITPSDATDKTLTWSSSDEKVAKVDKNGKVTGLKAGTTLITVKSSDGKEAFCTITVKSRDIMVYFHNPGYKNNNETDGGFKSDAIFIQAGDKSIIIDGGLRSRSTVDGKKTMKNNIVSYLKSLGVKKIDYYIGTHGHPDHVGMAGAIIKEFNIKNIIVPVGDVPEKHLNEDSNNKWFKEKENTKYAGTYKNYTISMMLRRCETKEERVAIEEVIANKKVQYLWSGYNNTSPYTFNIGYLKFTVINPLYKDWPSINEVEYNEEGERTNSPINANSLVLRMDNGNNSFLFAGDCSNIDKNDEIYKKYGKLMDVDVYKNGHHHDNLVAYTGKTKKRYNYIQPDYVILPPTDISQFDKSFEGNYFKTTSGILKNVYSTNCGPVIIKSTGSSISVVQGKQYYTDSSGSKTCKNMNYD